MKRITKYRIIITSLVILLVICATGLLIFQQSGRTLNSKLNQQLIKSEALLAEKFLIEKGLDRSKETNKKIDQEKFALAEALEQKIEIVSTQTMQNKRIKKALLAAEETLQEERKVSQALKERLANSERDLHNTSTAFSDSAATLASRVADLEHALNDAMLTSIDQTQITALKKRNERITSKARAVNTLVANVSVPGVFSDLDFVIEGPNGAVISDQQGTVTAQVLNEDETFTASTREDVIQELKPQTVQVRYSPEEKLTPGTYSFKIFNNKKYIGTMKVKLR